MQQDAPIESGIGAFAKSFGDTVAKGSQNEQQQAFKAWLETKKEGAKSANTATTEAGKNSRLDTNLKFKAAHPTGNGSKYSPADQHFYDQFTKARNTFRALVDKYKNPDMLRDMALQAKLKGMSPEQIENQAEIDYAKADPTGHDLLVDPKNQAYYKTLISPGAHKPIGAPTGAPQSVGDLIKSPIVPPGGPQSMAPPITPQAPSGAPPIQTAQAPPMPMQKAAPPVQMAQAPAQQMKMPPVGNQSVGPISPPNTSIPGQGPAQGQEEEELDNTATV